MFNLFTVSSLLLKHANKFEMFQTIISFIKIPPKFKLANVQYIKLKSRYDL